MSLLIAFLALTGAAFWLIVIAMIIYIWIE